MIWFSQLVMWLPPDVTLDRAAETHKITAVCCLIASSQPQIQRKSETFHINKWFIWDCDILVSNDSFLQLFIPVMQEKKKTTCCCKIASTQPVSICCTINVFNCHDSYVTMQNRLDLFMQNWIWGEMDPRRVVYEVHLYKSDWYMCFSACSDAHLPYESFSSCFTLKTQTLYY